MLYSDSKWRTHSEVLSQICLKKTPLPPKYPQCGTAKGYINLSNYSDVLSQFGSKQSPPPPTLTPARKKRRQLLSQKAQLLRQTTTTPPKTVALCRDRAFEAPIWGSEPAISSQYTYLVVWSIDNVSLWLNSLTLSLEVIKLFLRCSCDWDSQITPHFVIWTFLFVW